MSPVPLKPREQKQRFDANPSFLAKTMQDESECVGRLREQIYTRMMKFAKRRRPTAGTISESHALHDRQHAQLRDL